MKLSRKLKDIVIKNYEMLDEEEKGLLKLCSVLCTETDGVSMRCLYNVVGTDAQIFNKQIRHLTEMGLLHEMYYNAIYAPETLKSFLDDCPVPCEVINSIISRLVAKTRFSDTDLLQAKPYFMVASNTLDYVLRHSDGIDYEVFAKLMVNLTRHFEIFAIPDLHASDNSELTVMKGIRLAKSHLEKNCLLYAELCNCEAMLFAAGFWYDESNKLIDEALAIESMCNDKSVVLPFTYFVKALWHDNYGQFAECLAYAHKSWLTTEDKSQKDYVAAYISYKLCLHEEYEKGRDWQKKIEIKQYPPFHTLQIYWQLIEGLCRQSEDTLIKAEWLINQVNVQAPLKAEILYVRSYLYDCWGLTKKANEVYRGVTELTVNQYKATDGGTYIYIAAEVTRITNLGAISSAKIMVNDILDGLQLSHPGYSPAVKLSACWSFMNFYRTTGQFELAETYYSLGKELIEQYMIPSNETVAIVRDFFEDDKIPACISGDNYVWLLEHQHINLLSNKNVSRTDVQKEVENIKQRFPDHEIELDVINAATMHTYDALHLWNQNISKASKNERYNIALLCARFAASQGLLWDANQFYITAQYTEGYGCLNRYQKITFLLEMLNNMEECGLSGQSLEYWIDLEEMSEGTALYSEVLQARGNALYARSKYHEALKYLDRALEEYQPEKTVFDERLVSILAYRCCCLCAIGNYKEAHTAALHAKQNSRDDSFDIEFNLAYSSLAIGKVKDARIILDNAKTLAESDADRTSIADLTSILRLNKKERAEYFKKSLKKNTLL